MLVNNANDLNITVKGNSKEWNYAIVSKQTSKDNWIFSIIIKKNYAQDYIDHDKKIFDEYGKDYILNQCKKLQDSEALVLHYSKSYSNVSQIAVIKERLKGLIHRTIFPENENSDIISIEYYILVSPESIRNYMQQYNKQVCVAELKEMYK